MNGSPDSSSVRNGWLEQLLLVGRELTSELDLDVVLDRILTTARELTGARYAAVGVLDDRRRELAQFITSGIDEPGRAAIGALPHGRGVLGALIDNPVPLRLHEVSDHPRSYGFPLGHPPMHGFLGAPILIRGQAWGNLYLTERSDGADFDDDDEEAIVVLATWAAIAIDNARLFQASEARRGELERAVGTMEATIDISLAVGGETELARILELIAKRARALVQADALVILLRDGERLRAATHAGNVRPADGASIPIEGSTSGRALLSLEPLRVADAHTGLLVGADQFGMDDAKTALIVPLAFRGQGLGVLVAFDHIGPSGAFGVEDERALRSFAASAATAVATARSVEEQRLRDSIESAEAERRRWARELHDETLQGLGALKLALAASLKADPERGRVTLELAVVQLEQEIAALRAIIADLRPAALDELGLEPALRTLAARVAERYHLAIEVDVDLGPQRLPRAIETTAYRVTQEALTNVVKHAKAGAVTVRVDLHAGTLTLAVTDDGAGPAHGGSRAPNGFGIIGMRERAALAGGTLTIVPSDPRGTTVTLTVPVT